MDKDSKDQWENNFNYHAMKYFDTVPAELKKLGYKSFQSGKWWEYHFEYGWYLDQHMDEYDLLQWLLLNQIQLYSTDFYKRPRH